MITGSHVILSSTDAEADRVFLRDVLGLAHVDAGDGWLVFGLPPSELAVHPSESDDVHELYLLCDDVDALLARLGERDVPVSEVTDQGWGRLARLTLPGGGTLGVYEPRHARPDPAPGSLFASLSYEDAPAAIDFLERAFGFRRRLVVPGEGPGQVMHSELSLGGAVVMVGSVRLEEGRIAPRAAGGVTGALSIHVDDPDAHHAAAVAAGAEITRPLEDAPYGARGYSAKDPEGQLWHFSDYRPGRWWDGGDGGTDDGAGGAGGAGDVGDGAAG